jgi:cytochrome c oxidase assembly factor CtaG
MAKHLLLMVLAAPLILFGAVSRALLSALPNWFTRDRLVVMTRVRSLLGHVFDSSIFCWLAGTTTVVAWHVPFFFALSMSSHAWHTIEDLSFICAGLLFWKPIITLPTKEAQMPQWPLVLYLFLATVPCDILSAFLVFCGRVVYPYYLSTNQPFSLSALQDQECAGALMWVTVTFACLIPAVLITMSLLSTDGLDLEKGAAIASRGTDDLVLRIRGIDPVAQTLPAPPS